MKLKLLYFCGLAVILPIITECKGSSAGVGPKIIEDINASLIAPKLDSEQATSITFQWASSEKVDSFYFQLSGSKDFSSTIKSMPVDSTRLDVKDLPFDSTMYWRVRPVIDGSETDWSDTWNFRTIKMPESKPVKLLSPTDGLKDQATNVELIWQNVENATKYTIQIANENNFEVLVVDELVEKTSYQNSDLKYNKDYYWRIRALVPDVKTTWSAIYSFTTRKADSMPSPYLLTPKDNATNVQLKPAFKWKTVEGADSYLLHMSRADKMIIEKLVTTTTFIPGDNLTADDTFYWRVRAINNEVKGIWSAVESFTTESKTPAVTLVSPTDKAEVSTTEVLLKWETLQGVSGYTVQLAWDENFSETIVNETATNNSYQTSSLETGRTYYWRVQALNDGDVENWSSTASFTIKVQDNPSSSDRVALMDLYKATNGDQWTNSSGWGSDAPLGSWYGIDTDADGHVTRIDLWHNNLTGTIENIPWGNLNKVEYLNIKYNHLTGSIPSEIGKMTNLKVLILQGRNYEIGGTLKEPSDKWTYAYHQGKYYSNTNNFSGQIPDSIGNLSDLVIFELSNAPQIVGPIPPELGNLSNLKGLYLSGDNFNGFTIPSSFGNLTNLKHLYIEGAGLVGKIPDSIQNLTQLIYINFGSFDDTDAIPLNKLTGTIPDFSQFTELRSLVLDENDLTGSFPQYFNNGNFTQLNTLNLAWNNLTGSLPGFENMPSLVSFTASGNQLTGSIDVLTEMPARIKIIGVGWNNLSGDFPQSGWPDFFQLKTIYINNNKLTGNIPCSFWEKLDNPNLNWVYVHNDGITDYCSASAKAMTGRGSINLDL